MDYKKVGAAGVLLTLLLSGCGTQAATQDAAKQGSTTQGAAAQDTAKQDSTQQAKQNRPQMNEKQREMMMTFQTLIMMDKADGLAITKEEAEPMLAVVQDSITKGELTSDAQAKLTEKLTADQKKYVDDAAAKMKERMDTMKQGGNGAANGGGPKQGQRQAQGDASASKPAAATDANAGSGTATGQQAPAAGQDQSQGQKAPADANGKGGQRGGANGGGFGGGKNTGEQLVELLQAKLK